MKLDKEVFHALALIVWADGVVKESEVDALLSAARSSGLSAPEIEEIRRALEHRGDMDELGSLDLGHDERAFVYGIAAWLTRVDGFVSPEEVTALVKLGDLLHLSPAERRRAEVASFAISSFDAATGSPIHDVGRLAREIQRAAGDDRPTPLA